jgi:hypothetical protein
MQFLGYDVFQNYRKIFGNLRRGDENNLRKIIENIRKRVFEKQNIFKKFGHDLKRDRLVANFRKFIENFGKHRKIGRKRREFANELTKTENVVIFLGQKS